MIKHFSLANGTWCVVTVPAFDFVKNDCAVGSAILSKRGKSDGDKFSELTESAAMAFSMVCVMLQALYATQGLLYF